MKDYSFVIDCEKTLLTAHRYPIIYDFAITMSKERLHKHENRRAENGPILEAEKLIKDRLIWQHLARKKIKRTLKKILHISEGQ